MPISPPVALSIAGSDCSAGAGIQADLKTFSAHGVFGLTAVTCVVAEIPGRVGSIVAIPPEVLTEQLQLLSEGFPIAAIKTGMLYSSDHVRATTDWLRSLNDQPPLDGNDPFALFDRGAVVGIAVCIVNESSIRPTGS